MALSVLDAGVLIGFLDAADAHHRSAHAWLTGAVDRNEQLVVPASALAEVLVGPARRSAPAVAVVEKLLDRVPIDVQPVDRPIAVAAASIRARHRGLRLPDALVIATAIALDADHVVTTDHGWPGRSRLGLRAAIIRP